MAGLSLWNWIIVLAAIAGPVILIVTIIWLAVGLLRRSRNAAGSAPSHAVSQILATLEPPLSRLDGLRSKDVVTGSGHAQDGTALDKDPHA